MLRIAVLFTMLASLSMQGLAGNFQFNTELPPVSKDGFYKIELDPNITARLQEGFPDIRIIDNLNREVPYIPETEKRISQEKLFQPYKIIEKTHVPNDYTRIVVYNPDKKKINNICLRIKNAAAKRHVQLAGSDDNQQYFILKDHDCIPYINSSTNTYEIKILDFPWSDYKYFKILIDDDRFYRSWQIDGKAYPLNILEVGFYDTQVEKGQYRQVLQPGYFQSDSDSVQRSYVWLTFAPGQFVDKLELEVEGPKYYRREVNLYRITTVTEKRYVSDERAKRSRWRRKRRSRNRGHYVEEEKVKYEFVGNMDLRSDDFHQMILNQTYCGEMLMEIINHDNPPLIIKGIKGFQLINYLNAYLEKGTDYEIRFGNDKVKPPIYDLAFFRKQIPVVVPLLKTEFHNIDPNPSSGVLPGKKPGNNYIDGNEEPKFLQNNKTYLWLAILIVLTMLGILSYKMIKDLGKNQEEETS